MIFQLIYICALRGDVDRTELREIAQSSRTRNRDKGVTGILLYKDGSALQVLEGDKAVVTDLYSEITEDPRVLNPLVLIKRSSTEREFPNWSMGYRNADPDPTSFDLTANSLSRAMPDDLSPEINTIGRTFARVNGLT
jgi:hypothetical protein